MKKIADISTGANSLSEKINGNESLTPADKLGYAKKYTKFADRLEELAKVVNEDLAKECRKEAEKFRNEANKLLQASVTDPNFGPPPPQTSSSTTPRVVSYMQNSVFSQNQPYYQTNFGHPPQT
jgi:hypothetical protein